MSFNIIETNINLTWFEDCVTSPATGERKIAITDTKLNVLTVTLSTQDNLKLLNQLKSGLKKD